MIVKDTISVILFLLLLCGKKEFLLTRAARNAPAEGYIT